MVFPASRQILWLRQAKPAPPPLRVKPSKSNVRVFVAVTTKSLPPEASLIVAPGAPRSVSRLMPLMCKLSVQVPETRTVLALSGSRPARKLLSNRCCALLQLKLIALGCGIFFLIFGNCLSAKRFNLGSSPEAPQMGIVQSETLMTIARNLQVVLGIFASLVFGNCSRELSVLCPTEVRA